jgi:hypothetical protein
LSAAGAAVLLAGCATGLPRTRAPMYLVGGCASISADFDEKVWTGGGLLGSDLLTSVCWPASGDWKDSVEHWCVHNNQVDSIDDFAMHVLVGLETDPGKAIDFDLKRRTGEDGAVLHLEYGWGFVTFSWPLIWMHNVDAGSLGTTAIGRRTGDTLETFLVRNARQLDTPTLTTDCDTSLEIDSGGSYPDQTLGFAPGDAWDVVMCRHDKIVNSSFFAPVGSGSGGSFTLDLWYFDVTVDATDHVVVTPEDAGDPDAAEAAGFLAQVLAIARAQEIYVVPQNCPVPGP